MTIIDSMNRLKAIKLPDGSRREYTYDASTRRLATVTHDASGIVTETEPHAYGPGWERLADLGASFSTERLYITSGGMDAQVAMINLEDGTPQTYYYLRDHLGIVLALLDGATGEIVESNDYEPYGLPTITAIEEGIAYEIAASAVGNRFLYTGREWEPDAAIYHYRFRTYSPREKRFMQSDPIGLAGGWNHYAYVGGNPVNNADNLGLFIVTRVYTFRVESVKTAYDFTTELNEIQNRLDAYVQSLDYSQVDFYETGYINAAYAALRSLGELNCKGRISLAKGSFGAEYHYVLNNITIGEEAALPYPNMPQYSKFNLISEQSFIGDHESQFIQELRVSNKFYGSLIHEGYHALQDKYNNMWLLGMGDKNLPYESKFSEKVPLQLGDFFDNILFAD